MKDDVSSFGAEILEIVDAEVQDEHIIKYYSSLCA